MEDKKDRLIKFSYKFGWVSDNGYKHFPVLYFANGINGFVITLIGLSITFKYK